MREHDPSTAGPPDNDPSAKTKSETLLEGMNRRDRRAYVRSAEYRQIMRDAEVKEGSA